jgi:hypothetical protein
MCCKESEVKSVRSKLVKNSLCYALAISSQISRCYQPLRWPFHPAVTFKILFAKQYLKRLHMSKSLGQVLRANRSIRAVMLAFEKPTIQNDKRSRCCVTQNFATTSRMLMYNARG